MKTRQLRQEYFINDKLAGCGPLAHVLYLGLLGLADREGRLEERPFPIKVQTIPYYNCDIVELLTALHNHELITRYEVDGKNYIEILDFKNHQNIHLKEAVSNIPTANCIAIPRNSPSATVAIPSPNSNSNSNSNSNINTKERSKTTKAPKPDKVQEIKLAPEVDTPEVREALATWLDYKKEKNQSYKPIGLNSLYKKISEMGGGKFVLAVENSIQSNYSGLFAPSEVGGGRKETATEKSQRILKENHIRFTKMQEDEEAGRPVQTNLLFGGFL